MPYPLALGLTLLVEVPLLWIGLRHLLRQPAMLSITAAIGVNLATHPVLYFLVYPGLAAMLDHTIAAALAESLVMLAEWFLLYRLTRAHPDGLLVLSLLSNSASFLLGQALTTEI